MGTSQKATAEPPTGRPAVCDCGWLFGTIVRVGWSDREKDCLVLIGSNLRTFRLEAECPCCRRLFVFRGC